MKKILKLILPRFVKLFIKKIFVLVVKIGAENLDDDKSNLSLVKIDELLGMIEILNYRIQNLETEINKVVNNEHYKGS